MVKIASIIDDACFEGRNFAAEYLAKVSIRCNTGC